MGIVATLQLYAGGTASGLTPAFARNAVARQPDGTDVAVNTPRYGEKIAVAPVPTVTIRGATNNARFMRLGSGPDDNGTLVSILWSVSSGFSANLIEFWTGTPAPAPAGTKADNCTRYNKTITGSSPAAADPFTIAAGDTADIEAAGYFRGAVLLAAEAKRTATGATGMLLAVGNWDQDNGLSGSGGTGDELDVVYIDIGHATTWPGAGRLREWSCSGPWPLDDAGNDVMFSCARYTDSSTNPVGGAQNNEDMVVFIRATRANASSPWVFQRPLVGFDFDDLKHTHLGFARVATVDDTEYLIIGCNTGDGEAMNGTYIKWLPMASLDDHDDWHASYTYNGGTLEVAFADTPIASWASFADWSGLSGSNPWSDRRMLLGSRSADGDPIQSYSPQYVGCAPGPTRSIVLLGADITEDAAIVYYDFSTFDFIDGKIPFAGQWQRWGQCSQNGYAFSQELTDYGNAKSFLVFFITPDDPLSPRYYAAEMRQRNVFGGTDYSANLPSSILVGVVDGNEVYFGKVWSAANSFNSAHITTDGRKIFVGGSTTTGDFTAFTELAFATAPVVRRPLLLGAGYRQVQPFYAPGDATNGADQEWNALRHLHDARGTVTRRHATDAEIATLSPLPGLGPVYYFNKDAAADTVDDSYLVRSLARNQYAIISNDHKTVTPNRTRGNLGSINGRAEVLLAVHTDPGNASTRPEPISALIRIGDPEDTGSVMAEDGNINNLTFTTDDWIVYRITHADPDLDYIMGLFNVANGGDATARANADFSGFVQIIAATADAITAYPMGYHGINSPTSVGDPEPSGVALSLPNEVQTATGLGEAGTVLYRFVNDPHGVDAEWYSQDRRIASATTDHAFFSIAEGDAHIEVGVRNGQDFYVTSDDGTDSSTQIVSHDAWLQRHDDITLAVRYDGEGCAVDIWHNGRKHSIASTTRTPAFTTPTVRLGSAAAAATIPVDALELQYTDEVLTDEDLESVIAEGGLQQPIGGGAGGFLPPLRPRRNRRG